MNKKQRFLNLIIASKWKVWTAISIGIILIAALFVGVFGFNYSTDFVLSGTLDVEIGTFLSVNEDKADEFEKIITDALDEMGIKYEEPQKLLNNGYFIGFNLKFSRKVNGKIATEEQLNIIARLLNGRQAPDDMFEEGSEVTFRRASGEEAAKVKSLLSGTTAYSELDSKGDFNKDDAAVDFLGIYDRIKNADISVGELKYPMPSLNISGGATSPKFGMRLVYNFLLALALAMVLVFLYAWLRFGLKNALVSAIVALHNALITAALLALTRVVVSATSLGALAIAVAFGYYFVASYLAKMRENKTKTQNADWTPEELADNTMKEMFHGITIGAIITAGLLVILAGIALILSNVQIVWFAVSALIALIGAVYGTVFLTPAFVLLINNLKKNDKKVFTKNTDKK